MPGDGLTCTRAALHKTAGVAATVACCLGHAADAYLPLSTPTYTRTHATPYARHFFFVNHDHEFEELIDHDHMHDENIYVITTFDHDYATGADGFTIMLYDHDHDHSL